MSNIKHVQPLLPSMVDIRADVDRVKICMNSADINYPTTLKLVTDKYLYILRKANVQKHFKLYFVLTRKVQKLLEHMNLMIIFYRTPTCQVRQFAFF